MLRGRESLDRLVGKRRRTRSSHLAYLLLRSSQQTPFDPRDGGPNPPSSSSDETREGEEEAKPAADSGAGIAAAAAGTGKIRDGAIYGGSEWVSCPVCDSSIRGDIYTVNSHLDTCLSREGTKRKWTQRTLLQSSFCPRSRRESHLPDLDYHSEDAKGTDSSDEKEPDYNSCMATSSYGNTEQNKRAISSKFPVSNLNKSSVDPVADVVIGDAVNGKVVDSDSSYMFPESRMPPMVNSSGVKGAKSGILVKTHIVGRRFHDKAELQQAACISLLREPENAKDKHAIKVLLADSGCGRMLGYLPRELAKHLSPLMDNHYIKCEGSVISLPEHPFDHVPIQIVCQKLVVNDEAKFLDHQTFESLWENFLSVTENAKTYHPSMTKYQQNFCLMVKEVMTNHSHLFTDEERIFLGSFDALGDDGQKLFIRLYTRKGPWFRMSNISYPEISDSQKAIEDLQAAGYVCIFNLSVDPSKYDMKEVLEVLTVFEMREISNMELSKNGIICTRRKELIDNLSSAYEDGTCPLLPKMVLERAGTCLKISSLADTILWRVQRLFFLNGDQDLSSFLLVDLGLIKFPEYNCIVSHPIFEDRSDFLEYDEAVEVAQLMSESLDVNNAEMVLKCIDISSKRLSTYFQQETRSSFFDSRPTFFSCFSSAWVYSKVLSLGVSVYERERRYVDAVKLLRGLLSKITCDSRRGYWTLRLSVDLEHMGCVNESLSVAEEGVLDPWVRSGSKMALQKRVLRLGKPPRRWKMPSYADSVRRKIKEVNIRGRPLISESGAKSLFYGYDDGLCGVEQLALQYYAEEGGGWQGVHSESGIWMTIFGVLMWDIIFSNVPNAFRSRFQTAPLDLHTDNFYVARKNLIECHLEKIQEGMAEEILIISWELHFGTACQGVNWERHSLSDLRAAVSCIGGRCLASLCRHLALDYRSWSSGMPDLLLWRFRGDKDGGEAKLVEVKGPKDRLSEQQRAWLLILTDCGFSTEVCKVSPAPVS